MTKVALPLGLNLTHIAPSLQNGQLMEAFRTMFSEYETPALQFLSLPAVDGLLCYNLHLNSPDVSNSKQKHINKHFCSI